jgi:hypothetical protein
MQRKFLLNLLYWPHTVAETIGVFKMMQTQILKVICHQIDK